MTYQSLNQLEEAVEKCRLCKRLVLYRETVKPRPQCKTQVYWRKPVGGFGDPESHLFILGLAPSADGGNRTGRIFTGDETGNFLFKVLYKAGYASQSSSLSRNDGLQLKGCFLTAAVKCVPPKNLPTKEECVTCSQYWYNELLLLKKVTSVLVFGKFAFDAFCEYVKKKGHSTKNLFFAHGAVYHIPNIPTLYVSYHPSPQNTRTGKLTEEMLLQVLNSIGHKRI